MKVRLDVLLVEKQIFSSREKARAAIMAGLVTVDGISAGIKPGMPVSEDAKIEILDITDYNTPLGKIVIGIVKESGYVQIAGPQTNKGIKAVSELMLNLGAQLVLIDGAINRVASASPSVSEGVILATGAVLSRDMNRVINIMI